MPRLCEADLTPAVRAGAATSIDLAGGLFADLYAAVLSGRKANTLRAYQSDLVDFAGFLGSASAAAALDTLTSFSPGVANATALAYRAHLMQRKLAPATIGRRLAALKSACKVARLLGRIAWSLEIESPAAETYRDTTGPGSDGWRSILATSRADETPRGRRNLAIVRLLHDCALRRAEVLALDLSDFEPARGRVWIVGKGKTSRASISLPAPTRAALEAWVSTRGDQPGPMFCPITRDVADAGRRLTGESVRLIVADLGRRAGLSRVVRPHGLRHQAITAALDATRGDVRSVRKFSRHAKLETLITYDDNRADLAGDVAAKVAED